MDKQMEEGKKRGVGAEEGILEPVELVFFSPILHAVSRGR